MKKRAKALVTGLAGLSLLAGSGGTFALWNDNVTILTDASQILTGALHFTGYNLGLSWTHVRGSTHTPVVNPVVLQGGDKLVGTAAFTGVAIGTGLEVEFDYVVDGLDPFFANGPGRYEVVGDYTPDDDGLISGYLELTLILPLSFDASKDGFDIGNISFIIRQSTGQGQ